MLVVWHSSPGYSRLCITTRSQDVSLPIFHTVLYGLNCEGPQTNMPQNIGSINDLTSKNIHWVDTKLIVLREKFAWHQHDTERNKNRVARSRTQINQGEFIACAQTSPISSCNKGNGRRLHAGKGIYWPPAQWGSGRVIFLSRAPRSLCSRARRCFVKERKEK